MPPVNLTQKFPNLTPIKSLPSLWRINGCGVALYGKRDYDVDTNSHIATWCIALLFIPVLCLKAFRVVPAPGGGWYFLGREPLSAFAKRWNLLVLLAAMCIPSYTYYHNYTTSPAYVAKRKMATAQALVQQNQLGEAAKIYQSLATANREQSANAAIAMKELLDKYCPAASLSESAKVIFSAVETARRVSMGVNVADVIARGTQLVKDKGDAEPKAAVAILDSLRPVIVDTRPIDARRLELLRKWAATEPNNLDVIIPLASALADQGKSDDAKRLLSPFKDKLGDGEGARVLGTIFAREGNYDSAYALLWPYAKVRLDGFHAAQQAVENICKQIWERQIDLLDRNQGPRDFYDRYKSASEESKRAIVREYVNDKIKNDADYNALENDLEKQTAIVPVAMELGMVMLQRAQAQNDPKARKSQLEAAEQVFLAINGVAGQSDTYRLTLGQVYYWLGRQTEGRKLFDEFLADKGRSSEALLRIAYDLRSVGALPDARAMAEEAYQKGGKPQEQYAAANFRSLCEKDLDDEIAWLNKCDQADAHVKARLAHANGNQAFREGHDDEAVRQFRAAIAAYESMPRGETALNQAALAYNAIFIVTGDHQALDRAVDSFQQAVNLNPTDSVLLGNAGEALLSSALANLIGNDIDLRALHRMGNVAMLAFLYRDDAGFNSLAARVKAHPGIARALSFLEKLMVLAPRQPRSYESSYAVAHFLRDNDAMCKFQQRMQAANIDASDEIAATREAVSGAKDEQNKADCAVALTRQESLLAQLRAKGGPTAAVALCDHVYTLLAMDFLTDSQDMNKILAMAQDAHALAPSTATSNTLQSVYINRAAKELRRADPAFDAFWRKYRRSLRVGSLLAVAAKQSESFKTEILQHPDVKQAVRLMLHEAQEMPGNPMIGDWSLLRFADPAAARKLADAIRNMPRKLAAQSIDELLAPASAEDAVMGAWLMEILGKGDAGRAAIRRVAELGIAVPEQP